MIITKGKALSYNEAARRLSKLQEDREDACAELEAAEEKEFELEGEIRDLDFEINQILDQIGASDLTSSLPTELHSMGFKLTDVSIKALEVGVDLWGGESALRRRKVILENREGEILQEWERYPSLTDLFDIKKEAVGNAPKTMS